MKHPTLLAAASIVAVLALPLASAAQQQPQRLEGGARVTRSEQWIDMRWNRLLGDLNLTSQQQQQIQSYVHTYAQQHPQGSPQDRRAGHALRRQILGILSDAQYAQYVQEARARRQRHQQRLEQLRQQGTAPPRL